MLVNLARNFFGPDGSLYKAEKNPHSFPDDWELPKDAKKLTKKEAAGLGDDEEEQETDPKLVGSSGKK